MKSISLLNVSFAYSGCDDLFHDLSIAFHDTGTVAIVGDNGCGKSTLLKLLAGQLSADSGRVISNAVVEYLPQMTPHGDKSGGQHQMVELMRVLNSNANIVLLDEPTNNLDQYARAVFFDALSHRTGGTVIVSHDRELLRRVDTIYELSNGEIVAYGGDYDFYVATRNAARENLEAKYADTKRQIARLTDSISVAQNTRQHHEAKQKKEITNARRSRLEANALRGKSQETEARLRQNIQKKLNEQMQIQQSLSNQLRDDVIKIPMPSKSFYSKDLVRIENMCFGYNNFIFDGLNLDIYGGDRVHLTGCNGSGKSTLLKLIAGQLQPTSGTIKVFCNIAYLNQDLSLLDRNKTIVENIVEISGILKHDAHVIAANFGFRGDASRKRVATLSGGELLRATLAAVLGSINQPDLLILDEPTNNLDIKSTAILESALAQYQGAILLVSHDNDFVKNVNMNKVIAL